ncbi:MAG: hypothetical protein AABY86_00690 [Bdellovibrionota bacterium]
MELVRERVGMEKKFFELCQQVVSGLELELYDLEYLPGSGELRVYIQGQKASGVKIEDCVRVDQALTPFIDTLEWMPSKLILEVSSPGLYRKLRERKHFQLAIGETVILELSKDLFADVDPSKGKNAQVVPKNLKNLKKVRGKLLACASDSVEVEWQEGSKNDRKMEIPFANIKKANLDPDFNQLISNEVKT